VRRRPALKNEIEKRHGIFSLLSLASNSEPGPRVVAPLFTVYYRTEPERVSLLAPEQIFAGRYRILRPLARGGMGAVFEAEHTGTERRVALKVLLPSVAGTAGTREKFQQEAKISARVGSEHIVEVLDAGFDEPSGSLFLAMELLAGQTLAELIQSRAGLPPEEVIALLTQVAAGLDAAHGYRDARGALQPIIHRDLKPENIFVCRRKDGSSVAKILDFGIAKVLSDSTHASREVRGTPLYMAFEQVMAGALSPQTDVWALGLITYHALTGRRYWRSAEIPDSDIQALFAEILSLPLDPPSVRLRELGVTRELPAAFDSWLLRCLDRDPRRRFSSAGNAIANLRMVFDGAVQSLEASGFGSAAWSPTASYPMLAGARASLQPSTAASLPSITSERTRPNERGARPLLWAASALLIGCAIGGVAWWRMRVTAAEPAVTEAALAAPPVPASPPPTQPAQVRAVPSSSSPSVHVRPIERDVLPPEGDEPSTAPAPTQHPLHAGPKAQPAASEQEARHAALQRAVEEIKRERATKPKPAPAAPALSPFDPLNTGPSAPVPRHSAVPATSQPPAQAGPAAAGFDPFNTGPRSH
jgi:serine/threonine protein kinase